ncbi:hypothetical protein H8356DRAFT_1325399 [Neocallimastix lanati (nom. inval.)]|nr:hypothetical protein H8356DRAFT_1326366 [Neocallimastix sp. JGI-2020a]KAG4082719.1 hypothetical protein H8356DRAFT_1325399 [Neocallimastix sp. JGI-2020a]
MNKSNYINRFGFGVNRLYISFDIFKKSSDNNSIWWNIAEEEKDKKNIIFIIKEIKINNKLIIDIWKNGVNLQMMNVNNGKEIYNINKVLNTFHETYGMRGKKRRKKKNPNLYFYFLFNTSNRITEGTLQEVGEGRGSHQMKILRVRNMLHTLSECLEEKLQLDHYQWYQWLKLQSYYLEGGSLKKEECDIHSRSQSKYGLCINDDVESESYVYCVDCKFEVHFDKMKDFCYNKETMIRMNVKFGTKS